MKLLDDTSGDGIRTVLTQFPSAVERGMSHAGGRLLSPSNGTMASLSENVLQ